MEHSGRNGCIYSPISVSDVSILPITQATTATFTELYFRLTFLFFVQAGSKRVLCPHNGELIGEAGDLMIFPPGSVVTMENRPILKDSYRADGVCFTHELVDAVFSDQRPRNGTPGIQVLRAIPHRPFQILHLIRDTLDNEGLPPPIRQHRLLEPLIWLRHNGVSLPARDEELPLSKVRRLIEADLSHPWRISEVAGHFAMSEASLRRWLAKSGHGFARILLNTRLERGLTLLQTTDVPVSQIALECGFKTPSHFSDSFRKRFGIKPKLIRSAEH
ncbi:AraC family transcriptional regulator|uniref:AraC family transcriptional regulator n=1 Tax=Brenneria salicis ATCC 15712 = DSM 30166 TaxID=714314 RepID=A0A366I5V8_9GAMM|nr:AraC family transcriptional regulator [Brenneria salicis]NMN91463.1 AraC family transcriptional regulator [Brenneria salicis ATCC 15712 = DSM 30166]RBP62687.1 AraC family transcriptional regulator [Brenneria salicis ATCC 15712 = DSM 30166]